MDVLIFALDAMIVKTPSLPLIHTMNKHVYCKRHVIVLQCALSL